MLQVTIPAKEYFDPNNNEFIYVKETLLTLEHSLVSISKWESKWKKPFIGRSGKTYEESVDYVRCMTLTQHVDPLVYLSIPDEIFATINAYIDEPMTATWFNNKDDKPNREIVTSEVIYYWMIALNIPFECQKWHLNRLLTLIRVCNIKNAPKKKMSKKDILKRNRELNAARRRELNTTG